MRAAARLRQRQCVRDIENVALAELLEAQDGLVTRAQALARGVTPAEIRHRLGDRWRTPVPGVYATSSGALTSRQRLRTALLLGGPTAQLSGVTAARLHGVRYLPPDEQRTHVLLDHRVHRASHGFVVVQRSLRLPSPVTRHGLPLTPVPRAVIDTARAMSRLQDVRAVVADAVQRELTTPDLLSAELKASHSAGSLLVRRAVQEMHLGLRSSPECDLRDLVLLSTVLPEPEWNAPVYDAQGHLVGVADAWWKKVRMAGEVNSLEHHFFGETWEATMRRHARMAAAGVLVVPLSPRRIRVAGAVVLDELEDAYLSRLALVR